MLWPLLIGCTCGHGAACKVDEGRYFVSLPDDWDRQTPIPVVMHIHGYNGSPQQYLGTESTIASFSDGGVLLVLPEGTDGDWNVWGDPADRDELAFIDAVLADVADRYPIDADRVALSGQSAGSSLVSKIACEHAGAFRVFSTMAGGFWDPLPESCPSGPVRFQRTQGTADPTWPIEGRDLGFASQSAMDDELALWRAHDGCAETTEASSDGSVDCATWSECDGGFVRECLHGGGHAAPDGWVERVVALATDP